MGVGPDPIHLGADFGWAMLGALAFVIGFFAGLIGLVSMTTRESPAPVAGAVVAFCGLVVIISAVAFAILTDEIPVGPGLLGGLLVAAGRGLSIFHPKPRAAAPGTCGESTPQGRPCGLPPGHEGSHRYVTSTRNHPRSKESAVSPSS